MPNNFPWLGNRGREGEPPPGDEIPKEIKDSLEKIKEIDGVKTSVSNMEKKLEGLDSIVAFVNEAKKEKEDAVKAAAAERKAKENQPNNDDLAALLLTDPQTAVNKMTEGQTTVLLQMRADNLKRQVFEDRATEFPYYTGDVKKEIDKLLSSQPLNLQNNPSVIENTYYTVVGKKQKEINEGQVKSRFAQAQPLLNGSPEKEGRDKVEIQVTDDIRRAAKLSGMKVEDYVDLLRKDEGVEIV